LSSDSTKSGISTFLQLLQFGISVLSLQLFWYFIFYLVFAIWYLRSVSAIFFGVIFCLPLLQLFLEWYFLFRFCKIWYFNFPLASAMASTTKEIVWLRWLLADIRVFFSHPTSMYCDNQSSIQIAYNSVFHERTKHIEIDCHLTHHHLKHGTITLHFVPSSLQIADFFTKAHSISRFCFLVGKLSMLVAVASWVWWEMLNNIYLVLFLKGIIVFSV